MTFTADAKKECARLPIEDKCCMFSEMAAFIRLNGVLELGGSGKLGISMSTENPATARRMYRLIKSTTDLNTQVYVRRKVRLRKNYTYMVSVRPSAKTRDLLIELGMMEGQFYIVPGIAKKFIDKQCCRRAYMRGCFLASGAVSEPQKGRYHCEVLTHDSIHKLDFLHLSQIEEVVWHEIERKGSTVLYLKDSEQITNFLTRIGASSAALEYESARVYRDMRNRVNRLVNSETANLNKTLHASWRQATKIKKIEKNIGLHSLPKGLREVAQMRIENPEYSLAEIAASLKKPISKSAVNYRLKKIEELADELPDDPLNEE